MKRIYLACPYWHEDPDIRDQRYRIASYVAHHLMQQGHMVFSPLSHSVPIARWGDSDGDHEFWLRQDASFLLHWATDLYIICTDGTYESYGVNWEIDYWLDINSYGAKIILVDAETLEEKEADYGTEML